jgi:NAD(P)-dependent dehydrogenase (short-subunit alcohol dehydrogenase family)
MALEFFTKTIQINLIGCFNVIKAAGAAMESNPPGLDGERGVIINTASVAAFEGQIGQAAYSASKAGIVGMTLPIAREFARFGVRVNSVAPGIFLTPMVDGMPQHIQEALSASVPFPSRLGKPEEFAELVAHIMENGYINGETIRLDGAARLAPK